MRRLIAKELLENRIYSLGMLVATAILLGLGSPLGFRGPGYPASNLIAVVFIVSTLMGAAAYSRELSAETLPFLITRPVRWWWVYLSKLSAALIACAVIGIAAAIIYAVTVPAEYRPFIGVWTLVAGAGHWTLLLAMAYLVGFLFSCVLGGTIASLAVLAITYVLTLVLWMELTLHYRDLYHPLIPVAIAAVAASVICARAPVVVQTWPRVRRWMAIMAVGFVLMAGASAVLSRVLLGPPRGLIPFPSPDRQAAAFAAPTDFPGVRVPGLWVVHTRQGREVQLESGRNVRLITWSPDSRAIYYAILRNGAAQVKGASEDGGWRPFRVGSPVPLQLSGGDWRIYLISGSPQDAERMWSPSGTRLLVEWATAAAPSSCMMVVDAAARKAWRLPGPAYFDAWWIDDDYLASMGAGVIAVSAGTAKRR